MKTTALIMAGGCGERFWPKSRRSLPKQFLSLTSDNKTMIQLTVERILPIIDYQHIYVSTNFEYKKYVLEQLPQIPEENILCEPCRRNTAPGIGLAAIHIEKKYDDAIMVVLPSDHLIKNSRLFIDSLHNACEVAQKGANLVTIGITPDYPETGYGYIKFDSKKNEGNAYSVENFVEKPDLELAKKYLLSEEYIWNSGMFVWKTSTIMYNIKTLLPDMHNGLLEIKESIGSENYKSVLNTAFSRFQSISIDYGVMEKAKNIYTLPGAFGWDDVGSWLAVERINKTNENGNVIKGNVITVNCKNNIIEGSNKLIAAIGMEEVVIVDTDDALLICKKNRIADIKKVVENLKICNREQYI